MIDPTHSLPVVRQAHLLDVSRSSVYYRPLPPSEAALSLMRRIDELHLEHPFAGSRMLRDLHNRERFEVGRRHVTTLMRTTGIEALYQKPRTSGRDREHPVFPHLLRGMNIDQPNRVWAMDTTYIPMRRGFVYLTAVVDWGRRGGCLFRGSSTERRTPDDAYFERPSLSIEPGDVRGAEARAVGRGYGISRATLYEYLAAAYPRPTSEATYAAALASLVAALWAMVQNRGRDEGSIRAFIRLSRSFRVT